MNNHRVIALFLSCSWLSPPEYYGIGIQRKLNGRAIAPLHPGFIEKLLRDGGGGGALHSSRLAFTVRIFFTVRISRPTNWGVGSFTTCLFADVARLVSPSLCVTAAWFSAVTPPTFSLLHMVECQARGGTGRIPWGCGESYEEEESEGELWELRCFNGTTQKVQH